MDLKRVKELISDFTTKNSLNLFDLRYDKSDCVLTVLLDENFSMDELEDVSRRLSDYLDDYEDEFDDNYFLDVSTVGVERPIRNEKELLQAIGKYIYVQIKDSEYYGTLLSYEDGLMNLEVKDKNRKKSVSVNYKDSKSVRYAVEF